jgi:hypothetical protein
VASPLTPEEEWNKRAWDEARERIRKFIIDRRAWDIEDYLASQLGTHRAFLDGFISGREEASEALRQQIAALVKNLPNWHQRNEALILAGVREVYPKFCRSPIVDEGESVRDLFRGVSQLVQQGRPLPFTTGRPRSPILVLVYAKAQGPRLPTKAFPY